MSHPAEMPDSTAELPKLKAEVDALKMRQTSCKFCRKSEVRQSGFLVVPLQSCFFAMSACRIATALGRTKALAPDIFVILAAKHIIAAFVKYLLYV
jgi:hypothetical protein